MRSSQIMYTAFVSGLTENAVPNGLSAGLSAQILTIIVS